MDIKDIPLIIANYNQLTYLHNLINQFRFFYPENPIWVVDNNSTYQPLLDFYKSDFNYEKDDYDYYEHPEFTVIRYRENNFIGNLNHFINWHKPDLNYMIISDPDISIPFTTFPKFLEVFKAAIDSGYHHAGFGLRTDNIPSWNKKAGWIQGDEEALKKSPVSIEWNGQQFLGFKAALDTTFALYKRENGGWEAPMNPKHWDNSVRIFEAEHLTWYLHPEYQNEEMRNYFQTCLKRDDTKPSAGRNHFRPE